MPSGSVIALDVVPAMSRRPVPHPTRSHAPHCASARFDCIADMRAAVVLRQSSSFPVRARGNRTGRLRRGWCDARSACSAPSSRSRSLPPRSPSSSSPSSTSGLHSARYAGRPPLQIVSLILRGHSSLSISHLLDIAEGTVKNHRKHIHAKLGISGQSELIYRFVQRLIARPSNAS